MPKKVAPPPSPESLLPLAPATFDILLSLADAEHHGYAIMQEVNERAGSARLGPGTLYGALKRLLAAGLVEETERDDPDADARRRYYRLTRYGLDVARAEARRLARAVQDAQRKRLIVARST